MAVFKHILPSGRCDWRFSFDLPHKPGGPRRKAQKSGFATRKAAQDAEAERRLEEKRKAEEAAKAETLTLRQLIAEFIADSTDLSPVSVYDYEMLARYISAPVLETPIDKVTALQLHKEWKRINACGGKNGRPLSPRTVKSVWGVVSAAYDKAILWGLVATNPAEHSDPPKVPRRQVTALFWEQQNLLIAAANPEYAALLELARSTACRCGELVALRCEDLMGDTLIVREALAQTKQVFRKGTKTERARAIPLDARTVALLQAHIAGRTGAPMFRDAKGGFLKPRTVSAYVSKLFKRCKIAHPKGSALHLFRHSHISQALAGGADPVSVAKRAGHSSPRTTMEVYAHVIADRDREALKKWEEFQQRSTGKETRQ